jgi:hypothetical protein
MYYHEAMNAPDKEQFQQAMLKEINTHFENNTFELRPRSVVPKGVELVPSVWAMKKEAHINWRSLQMEKSLQLGW